MLYEPTCEICGHHIEDDRCEYCRNTGSNGDWINKVIEQAKDPRHDQSAVHQGGRFVGAPNLWSW